MKVIRSQSGNRIDYIITSDDLEEIGIWIEGTKQSYHPAGYGTSFGEPRKHDDGKWEVRGYRYASCD